MNWVQNTATAIGITFVTELASILRSGFCIWPYGVEVEPGLAISNAGLIHD